MHLINTSLWVFEHTQESMIAIHLWGFWIQAVDPDLEVPVTIHPQPFSFFSRAKLYIDGADIL